MRFFQQRKWIVLGALQVLVLIGVFFGGAFAHRQCMFPFCRGFYVDTLEELISLQATQGAAVAGNGARLEAMSRDTIETNLYEVVAEQYAYVQGAARQNRWDLVAKGRDGGIENLGDGLLIASAEGDLMYLDEALNRYSLSLSIPVDREPFEAAIRGTPYEEATPERLPVRVPWFGVKDILVVDEAADRFRLLASYHHWDTDRSCSTLRVAQIGLRLSGDSVAAADDGWQQVYETEPCLALKDAHHPFAGLQSGGRIVPLSDDEVLLSVGDQERDGVYSDEILPQDETASYGKTLRVNLKTGQARHFTSGHRNPQGLHVDAQGRIWSTEHGPKGGDELNRIRDGENYGWPLVTYGTDSGSYDWPLAEENGSHEGFTRPIFAWVPSPGISQLISINQDRFARWQGDLIVSSLSGETLYRMRIREGRVVLAEPIRIGRRIRDLVERPDGTLALKTDSGVLVMLRPTEETEQLAHRPGTNEAAE